MKLDIEMYLLDMDGTIYLDDELISGALDFINHLQKNNIKYVFLTNNSSKSQNDYLSKLHKLNIPASNENIFTSGMAMGMYLQEHYYNKRVYLVGTKNLYNELISYNVNLVEENPDVVVVGFDRELNYSKLEKACEFIDDGAVFLATNPDYVCPIANKRYIPDCGSICDMITNATKKKPFYIGKPSAEMINIIKKRENIANNKVAMVGDRLYTDIKSGFNANVVTMLVLSGESTLETLKSSDVKPDYVFNSVNDIYEIIKGSTEK